MKIYACLAAVVLLFSSCSHYAVINSKPSGASVMVDDQYLGETPVVFEETTGTGKSYVFRIEKEGYKEIVQAKSQIVINDGYLIASVIGGVFCLFPFIGLLYIKQLPDNIYFELEPIEEESTE